MTAPERRQQLAEAAATQFHHLGYHRVTVADLASAVGVTPPAIYRHFANKRALLQAAVDTGLRRIEQVLESDPTATWEERVDQLADAAAERRDVWVLLQREMRHLPEAERRPLERRFALFVARLREELTAAHPELDATEARLAVTAILAVLSSQATYPAHYPADERRRILGLVAKRLSSSPSSSGPATGHDQPATPGAGDTPTSKADELVTTAIQLFHERGFEAVSLDDIGASVGMAGPSILHHFPTKADLLVSAYRRASKALTTRPGGAADSLTDLVEHYVDFAVRERLLFGVYILEAASLPPAAARQISSTLRRDIETWRAALAAERPGLTDAELTMLVHAARAIVHDVIRIGRLHRQPGIRQDLVALVLRALDTTVNETDS